MAQIDAFFKLMNEQGASDLHLVAGQQPVLRIRGELERVKFKTLDNSKLENKAVIRIPEKVCQILDIKKGELVRVKPIIT